MKTKRIYKAIIGILASLLVAVPAFAVFNEKDLSHTLSVLRFELRQQNEKMESSRKRIIHRNQDQHNEMVDMIKKCNELSLILYSQNQDYTFDMTYALKEVTDKYQEFSKKRMPFDEIVSNMNIEIERYERLIESLRRLPPVLDEIAEVPDSIRMSKDSIMLGIDVRELSVPDGPFMLDEGGREDRDSCIMYAINLLKMYSDMRDGIVEDNGHYSDMSARLKESYDYAQERYKIIQKNIFIHGQDNYFKVIRTFPKYAKTAFQEAAQKYRPARGEFGSENSRHNASEWRGTIVIGFVFFVLLYLAIAAVASSLLMKLLSRRLKSFRKEEFKTHKSIVTLLLGVIIFALTLMLANVFVSQHFFIMASRLLLVFAWLLAAIIASLLIRTDGKQVRAGVNLNLPVVLLGLIVITLRIMFIPNRMVNLIFPPLLLGFAIWQYFCCRKNAMQASRVDRTFGWISFVITVIATIIAWTGYVLMSVQVYIWWLFQLSAIATVTAIKDMVDFYMGRVIEQKKVEYARIHPIVANGNKGTFIEITWLYDLLKMTVLPILAIVSILASFWLASDVFDLTEVCRTLFSKPFFNLTDADGNEILHLSLLKIVFVASMYFIFRFVNYIAKSFYRNLRISRAIEESSSGSIHASEVNLTLANNVISILVWGTYIAVTTILLKIPIGALSIVAAGLATGLGLAMKDILNNFIYGIQLMSGRLRVGDYIECDGIRGKVKSISYQSTQILTLDDCIIAFTNTALFNKNFKNLTRNSYYELVKIPVGVHYGADVNKVRTMITEALEPLCVEDKYGRPVIDPKKGITVAFSDFGDSSVDLVVKQFVLVEEEAKYMADAREIIYNTLNENGVEIPFPQRDIHIRN